MKKILAFDTSCDDTAVAIVDEAGYVLSEAVFSQFRVHEPFMGVVPEIGSRAHIEQILHVTKKVFVEAGLSFHEIDAVAATFAPGLLGPLLVGAQFAKGVAVAQNIPLIAVHHIEGHIFSGFGDSNYPSPPFLALIASGGHTALYVCDKNFSIKVIGETLDDAAGEAFDKIGRALGLGYPAGKIIDELAMSGDPLRFPFPIALRYEKGFNFSFSGLKTKAIEVIKSYAPFDEVMLADFCASIREAIARALCERSVKAARENGLSSLVIGGGVAANFRVRALLASMCKEQGIDLYLPDVRYCTDNAVMIAKAAHIRFCQGCLSNFSVDVVATLPIERRDELVRNVSST
jgi:N6-L-threonylcarbamoyladenine synthase